MKINYSNYESRLYCNRISSQLRFLLRTRCERHLDETGQPASFVNVVLMTDSTLIDRKVTDDNGLFIFENSSPYPKGFYCIQDRKRTHLGMAQQSGYP